MSLSWPSVTLVVVWVASEIGLALARRSRSTSTQSLDRSSLWILWIVITLSATAGVVVSGSGWGAFAGPRSFWEPLGVVLILAGLALRWWAILSLKQAFTVDVAIATGQRLVESGVYGVIRHPAYTGTLLSFVGLGLALGNWASLVAIVIPIGAAFLYRIAVEERALRAAFGEEYARYARRTRRLVPFLY